MDTNENLMVFFFVFLIAGLIALGAAFGHKLTYTQPTNLICGQEACYLILDNDQRWEIKPLSGDDKTLRATHEYHLFPVQAQQ